ncbi:MAG TPA: CpsB/CapC family capsule biosynthesis tyrosine phosphatase [Chitinophagaceae bacterium]|nr:CpsB/CapC family capsule biosynthesis tyrosine phosphatase [Chitinophagaceae bacterium]
MFKLFSKPASGKEKFDFSILKTDMHSHLLPGIDDGANDLENSLELIRGLKALGYKKLITTPHILWDMYRNTPAIIAEKLELVKKAVENEGIDIEIEAAAEYFLDEHVRELLHKKEPLLTLSGNLVLTEFSMAYASMNVKDILFDMQMQGYQPVIAHPERYAYLQRNKDFFVELKDIGCLFQLNLLSLSGGYGRVVAELANYLLKNGFYDMAGTDLHHTGHVEALKKFQAPPLLKEWLDAGKALNSKL